VILTVGVADLKISKERGDTIVTHALGSCLGITIYDPVAAVGGMLHAMLPDSSIDPKKGLECPFMFVDTGLPRLFKDCYKLGADKTRLIVKVAGGATSKANLEDDYFQIGKRNFVQLRKMLWKNNVLLKSYDVGGTDSRTMSLELGTGDVLLKVNGAVRKL
jgi:chemotaxis protein CheD